jgi:hypothetical protein
MTDPRSPDARRAGAWPGRRPALIFHPRRIAGEGAEISTKSEYAGGVFVDGTPVVGAAARRPHSPRRRGIGLVAANQPRSVP